MPFKKGQSKTGGRKKGVRNILPSTAKEKIEKVVDELGGWARIKEWAQKNQRNEGLLYGWYFKMLPSNVTVDGDLNVTFQASEKFMPKTDNEKK